MPHDTWTVIATRPQGEGRAEDDVRRAGIPAFKPIEFQTTRRRGRERQRVRLLCPGYVFASVQGRNALASMIAQMRDRPRGIVGEVRDGELDPLRAAYGAEPEAERPFKVAVGTTVPVHAGPFQGFTVRVLSVMGNRIRGAVGQFQAVIPIDHLRPG